MTTPRRNDRRLIRDIAHARAGDKGNTSNISVWAYNAEDYAILRRSLTPERLKRAFPQLIRGRSNASKWSISGASTSCCTRLWKAA